jgi:hypothetical protein
MAAASWQADLHLFGGSALHGVTINGNPDRYSGRGFAFSAVALTLPEPPLCFGDDANDQLGDGQKNADSDARGQH